MSIIEKFKHQCRKIIKDEKGSFGIMAAVTLLMLIFTIGAAVDISRTLEARAKLQTISDNVGLYASIYVRDNKEPPKSSAEGYVEGVKYDLKGIPAGTEMLGVSGDFSVVYNEAMSRSEVSFEGEIATTFMAAFNKSKLDMKVKSQVQYYQTQQAATSVFMVVDNSGSMAWDDTAIVSRNRRPDGAQTRIDGLKSTITKFNEDLDASLSEANLSNDERYLRTALIPYSTDTLTTKVSQPNWGTISTGHTTRMVASGGTGSRGPLKLAKTLMQSENNIHFAENETRDPKKYVIFMTDGANNEEWNCDWYNRSRTRLWRQFNGNRYNYVRSSRSPGNGYVEGVAYNCKLENKSNSESVAVCQDLKNEGVEVFTVGFALEPGTYYADAPRLRSTATITQATSASAYDFLRKCASSESQFIIAKDSEALDLAFEKIGKTIAQDSIRISG